MKKLFLFICIGAVPFAGIAQVGHIMQGIGAVNMSMGGAATAQPLDINGALNWNPAGISVFHKKIISVNAGAFFSSPELSSTVQTPGGPMSGVTKDERGASIMPAIAMVFGKAKSKHTFGIAAFGVSGFGVTFPQSATNPINMPQSVGGFGPLKSDYMLMQVGFTYAYKVSEQFSVGIAPTFNYSALLVSPDPLATPNPSLGYPVSDKASALGIGAQFGLFYQPGNGFKLGLSYKTKQAFKDFKLKNTYLEGSNAPDVNFKMNFPSIISAGLGYTNKLIDFALDYRYVDYDHTEGFAAKGWTATGSVAGFGWKNISVVSTGIQYKGISKFPIRVGYTYSSSPISNELAFFSIPATAIIKNGFQIGCGFELNNKINLNAVYHHGTSSGTTAGMLLSPMMVTASNPYGKVPGSRVAYSMTTDLIMLGLNLTL